MKSSFAAAVMLLLLVATMMAAKTVTNCETSTRAKATTPVWPTNATAQALSVS
ncbi:hypothetical protein [uncultured Pontibacter sp.]|uniref:hypothetical protein n=1 Tax=uncultured Pontibacter sp. TaxID=453356 RepID=UPI00261D5B34|nr:hypothetical protein [uncultured Pontibacter sp.]